ncbi:MAG: TlpA family protein disulfide reductase [Cyclobacteriaceae bacterium]|nr:TlpA family protein disulfide reductase [Cyclobacteriaceae bacterium]
MKKLLLTAFFAIPSLLFAQQQAEIVKLKQLQEHINRKTDNIKIINFWATWCAPCIKEMPYFEKIGAERKDVDVTFVSLDLDLNPKPEVVYRFIERKKIQSKVLILDEKDPNSWINQIEKGWSGAIPATIIINGKTGQRKFVEKELHEGDLEKLISEIL